MSMSNGQLDKITIGKKVVYPTEEQDMALLEQFQEILLQSEKMLSVGGLAAGMAHEINNILAGILQNIQVLEHRLSTTLPKNKQVAEECGMNLELMESYMQKRGIPGVAATIKESGLRAAAIVNDMLNFSRINKVQFSSYSITELLDKTVALASKDYNLQKRYDFRHIRISREYSPDTPLVACEAGKMQQVFFNILKNGAEAMYEIQNDSYRPSFLLKVYRDEDFVRADIQDNGPGMTQETLDSIFDPFFTTKSHMDGTGLGLSVSAFIITKIHKGRIEVDTAPGQGATFSIFLPLNR